MDDEIEIDDQAREDVEMLIEFFGIGETITPEERRRMELMAMFDNSRYEGGA